MQLLLSIHAHTLGRTPARDEAMVIVPVENLHQILLCSIMYYLVTADQSWYISNIATITQFLQTTNTKLHNINIFLLMNYGFELATSHKILQFVEIEDKLTREITHSIYKIRTSFGAD